MDDMDALAWPHTKGKRKKKTEDIGTVADFIEILNATVGKHLKCCICLRSVGGFRVRQLYKQASL